MTFVQRALFFSLVLLFTGISCVAALPIGKYAWSDAEWLKRCRDVRTSYNPDHALNPHELTIKVDDPRFDDFLYWAWMNQIPEHQVEPLGGEGWDGPADGVIFHWAPGSRWEAHTVLGFGATIGHVVGEHGWQDTHFPDFFCHSRRHLRHQSQESLGRTRSCLPETLGRFSLVPRRSRRILLSLYFPQMGRHQYPPQTGAGLVGRWHCI